MIKRSASVLVFLALMAAVSVGRKRTGPCADA